MNQRLISALFLLLLASCARVQTLNLEKYDYSERPNHILWIQIAGFSEEHIPLLRFNTPEANYHSSLENISCLGKMWNFNLYELRPNSFNSFLSQINGSKNIKGQCDDFTPKPVWSYLSQMDYVSSIFENGATEDQRLSKSLKCPNGDALDLSKLRYFNMGPSLAEGGVGAKSFHYQDTSTAIHETMLPGSYYDKSCQKNICYSSFSNNLKTLWDQASKQEAKTFFVVRDFNFSKGLKKKDIGDAKESLQEIERFVDWVKTQKRRDVLILITGAETLNIELPKEGKEWADFERSGKNIIYKNSSLMSPVLAFGPMSENFCGLFDESEMLKRILYRSEKKQIDWKLINPFSNL